MTTAVRRAARIGDIWVSSMNPSFEELKELLGEFDDAREGRPPALERPTMGECYIGATSESAISDVRDILYSK